jgi:phage gpG-like protein
MALLAVKGSVKLLGIEQAFRRLGAPDRRKAFKESASHARQDQLLHDIKSEGPDGRWPELHPSTKARYAKKAKTSRRRAKPRKLLGRLPKALQTLISPNSLIVRSRVKWAYVHQAGGTAGHGARIPRRQFLWISANLGKRVVKVFERFLLAQWNGK